MSPWEFLWIVIQWAVALLAVIIVLSIAAAVVVGVIGGMSRWRKK
jgi:hypothetical protein